MASRIVRHNPCGVSTCALVSVIAREISSQTFKTASQVHARFGAAAERSYVHETTCHPTPRGAHGLLRQHHVGPPPPPPPPPPHPPRSPPGPPAHSGGLPR